MSGAEPGAAWTLRNTGLTVILKLTVSLLLDSIGAYLELQLMGACSEGLIYLNFPGLFTTAS